MDIVEGYLKYFWKEVSFIVVVIVYLLFLNNLNHILISKNITNAIEILKYDGWKPTIYFICAICLFAIGIWLIVLRFKQLLGNSGFELNDISEIIAVMISMLIIAITLITIFQFIKVPILKAVLAVVSIGFGISAINK